MTSATPGIFPSARSESTSRSTPSVGTAPDAACAQSSAAPMSALMRQGRVFRVFFMAA
jgi:hypothetical protein